MYSSMVSIFVSPDGALDELNGLRGSRVRRRGVCQRWVQYSCFAAFQFLGLVVGMYSSMISTFVSPDGALDELNGLCGSRLRRRGVCQRWVQYSCFAAFQFLGLVVGIYFSMISLFVSPDGVLDDLNGLCGPRVKARRLSALGPVLLLRRLSVPGARGRHVLLYDLHLCLPRWCARRAQWLMRLPLEKARRLSTLGPVLLLRRLSVPGARGRHLLLYDLPLRLLRWSAGRAQWLTRLLREMVRRLGLPSRSPCQYDQHVQCHMLSLAKLKLLCTASSHNFHERQFL